VHRAVFRSGVQQIEPRLVIALTENPDCVDTIWPDPWGGATIQVKLDESNIDSLGSTLRRIAGVYADVVTLKPSLLELLMANSSTRIASCLFVSGSDISVDMQKAAASRFGVPVVEGYGTTETQLIASNCSAFAGLHVDCDVGVEVVDELGRTLPDGELGSLVFTSLRNSALPLIRYCTGDFGRIDRSRCVCGRVSPRITALAGRNMGNFSTKRGSKISPTRFHALFDAVPIREFQMTEARQGHWSVVVEPIEGQTESSVDELKAKVAFFIRERAAADVELDVTIGAVDRGSGKYQRYRAFGSNRA
jgi:phenylacetate-coenzyme A ligase PaaK-like adenylate-forming protein